MTALVSESRSSADNAARDASTKILVLSGAFPSSADPTRGIFVKERVRALANIPGIDIRVLAPTPWAPPLRSVPRWYTLSRFPDQEMVDGLTVYRPRYCLPPKVGGYFHPQLMYPAAVKAAQRIYAEFPFDLVDSHFVYPSGVTATKLAKRFRVPACVSGRGADMLRFPSMPMKGRSIRWTLENAEGFIALSQEIAEAMVKNGAEPSRLSVIPNGVDIGKFRLAPRAECRHLLGLPAQSKVLLTVGDRLELKGFHLVIEAMPKILSQHPDAVYVLVGGPGRHGQDFSAEIAARIDQLGLQERIILAGPRGHDELYKWYNAADLYVLASSREGSPNALLEALACGTPAVVTPVGGAPDEIESTGFGVVMRERSAHAAAEAIHHALSRTWDRDAVRRAMEKRSWRHTAQDVVHHFRRLLPKDKAVQLGKESGLW